MKSAGGAVAKEALRTGAAIASDVAEGRAIGQAALERGLEVAENLADEAVGAATTQLQKRQAQRGRGLGKRPAKGINSGLPQPPQAKKAKRKSKAKPKKKDTLGSYW